VAGLLNKLKKLAPSLRKMRDLLSLETLFEETDDFLNPTEIKMELGKGTAQIHLEVKDGVYHRMLASVCGEPIENDLDLLRFVRSLTEAKHGYERVKDALKEAETNGYGIVYPRGDEYRLDAPKLIKKSAGYGVQFRANAASYHIVRVDITGTVSPVIGTKEQGEDFARDTLSAYENGDEIWDTNIFGKSLHALVSDELSIKSNAMSQDARKKLRRVATKLVNEGKTNVFCWVF
jgi:stage IV sporulation protein A